MSVDTRTPRPGFDDQPALSMVKVDSDPAQVIVNHASFRVRLAPAQLPKAAVTPRLAALAGAAGAGALAGAGAEGGRRRPVVWTGKSAPGATGLLQAVRASAGAERTGGVSTLEPPTQTTQTIPRIDDTMPTPVVRGGGPGGAAEPPGPLLPPMRRAEGAYDDLYEIGPDGYDDADGPEGADQRARAAHRHGSDPVRHAYYPGRRMNLGVVLLPLRVFLGFISIYAGMGKLCDPVYFDGGERGSMVKWLHSLHPWALAEPLRDFALQHPVGAGLTVAFLQVVVGVLTVLGLWQRVAAVVGALLSAALILTVSWKTVPVYDAPDIIYLAAWSPLIIAGAPVYSIDGRLAGEAWRTLGPRSELWELRRRVLRRSTVVAAVVVGLTLLIGSMLGGAVRSSQMVTVPGPNEDPANHLPGEPLPQEPGTGSPSRSVSKSPKPSATSGASGSDEKSDDEEKAKPSESARETQRSERRTPTATQGSGTRTPSQSRTAAPPSSSGSSSASAGSSSGSSSGGSGSGGSGGSPSGSGGSSDGGSSSGGARNPIGGLLG
ncbi:DoxX family membrane protein [Streptomyces sp. NPDC090025]|uniref:DoxX family membrane protein n=1 Tax=Streptomyces sp. NPDC090025 TaxID=3365922 RepID=UPI003832351E